MTANGTTPVTATSARNVVLFLMECRRSSTKVTTNLVVTNPLSNGLTGAKKLRPSITVSVTTDNDGVLPV